MVFLKEIMVNFNHKKLIPVFILLLTGCTTILGRRKRESKLFKFSDCGESIILYIFFIYIVLNCRIKHFPEK